MDTLSTDSFGNLFNLEIQRRTSGFPPERVNFYSYMAGVRTLYTGERFKNIRDFYTLVIYEKDPLKKGYPSYTIEKKVRETNKVYCFNEHIQIFNGTYREGSIGSLMKDLSCTNPEEIQNKVIKESVMHFKQPGKGREKVCQLVENYAKNYAKKAVNAEKEKTKKANEKAKKAIEQAKIANEKTKAAFKQTKLANEKVKVANEKVKVANEKVKAANKKAEKAKKEKEDAKKAREDSIMNLIKDQFEQKKSKESAIDHLIKIFSLEFVQAEHYVSAIYN